MDSKLRQSVHKVLIKQHVHNELNIEQKKPLLSVRTLNVKHTLRKYTKPWFADCLLYAFSRPWFAECLLYALSRP